MNKDKMMALIRKRSKESGVSINTLLLLYFFEHFLERIAASKYRTDLILKGGFLLSSVLGIQTRTTMDMDMSLRNHPLSESEIKKIIHRSTSQVQKIELDVKAGDKIRIISGPFADFVGDITEVYPDKAKLRVSVSVFGRETPVELEYKQIQKI